MMSKMYLKITVPSGIFYENDVEIITLKMSRGYIGIQPGHSTMFSNIEIGTLTIGWENKPGTEKFFIGGGLIYVLKDKINIITDDIINVKDIDIERAIKERDQLENKLRENKYSAADAYSMELKLKKTLLRIDTYNKK
ncbi:ATP synthase F1 subunit epsilon [Mycoplasma sp. CSL10137]|nr:ATP synthase F1 subunit epsilon [Mycoplasma sp. CSL10137]MBN4084312.1 ATP synthase F1 subunit epsilon [Mycoplasma sp. CSL10166]MBU4692784.1 ATP synthase F1 subunit epsilon [Mycoplasma sp. CSL7491-lung]